MDTDDGRCDVCGGDDHETQHCHLLVDGTKVEDARCPSRAVLTVPANLRIKVIRRQSDSLKSSYDGNPGDAGLSKTIVTVQARENVPANTRFGPLEARRADTTQCIFSAPSAFPNFPLKIFREDGSSFVMNTSDEEHCNWMCLVQTAQTHADHNLIALQVSDSIYFVTKRNIRIHEELRVWYAPNYGRKMGFLRPPWPAPVESSMSSQDLLSRPTKKRKTLMGRRQATEMSSHDSLPRRTPRRRATKVWKEYVENSKEEDDDGVEQQQEKTESTGECGNDGRKTKTRRKKGSVDVTDKKQQHHGCQFCVRKFVSTKVLHKHESHCRKSVSKGKTESATEVIEHDDVETIDTAIETTYGTMGTEVSVIIVDDGTGETNRAVLRLLQDGDNIYVTGGESDETNVVGAEIIASGQILMEAMQEIEAYNAAENPCGEYSAVELITTTKRTNEIDESELQSDTISTDHFNCPKCQNMFTNEEDLSTHVMTCSALITAAPRDTDAADDDNNCLAAAEPTFACNQCGENFISICLLKRHLTKSADGRNICAECGKSYCTERFLRDHICCRRLPNADGLFCCNICHKTFTKLKYLDKHTPIHTGNHACQICGKWLRSRDSLQNHMRICGQVKELEQNGSALCSHCKREFTNVLEFRRHLYEHTHLFQCEKCAARFRNKVSFDCHVCSSASGPIATTAYHRDVVSPANLETHKPTHESNQVPAVMITEEEEVSHIRITSGIPDETQKDDDEKEGDAEEEEEEDEDVTTTILTKSNPTIVDHKLQPFVCNVCGSFFSSRSSLNVHKRLHGEKLYGCGVCGKRFHRKDMLADHRAKHGDPSVPCPVCQKRFKTKKSLDVHLLLHNGRKRFSCQTCGKQFYQRGNLTKHEEVHNEKRRHACPTCAKEFNTKEYLAIHVLEHTTGRKFACTECGKGFLKEHQLKAHQRMLHTNRVYVCKFCGRNIKLKHSLKRHLTNKHADEQHLWNSSEHFSDMLMPVDEAPPVVQQESRASMVTSALSIGSDDASSKDVIRGGEMLLAVTGIGSEALQQALESGSACIRPGATPNTIEISLPLEHPAIQEVMTGETVESISTFVQSEVDGQMSDGHLASENDDQYKDEIQKEHEMHIIDDNEFLDSPSKSDGKAEEGEHEEASEVGEMDISGTFVLENGTVLRQGISADGSNVLFYLLTSDEQMTVDEDEDDPSRRQ